MRQTSTVTATIKKHQLPVWGERRYSVGLDLGQVADPTALAVLETKVVHRQDAMFQPVGEDPSNRLVKGELVYDLVYLKRYKLHTPYDEIARDVVDKLAELEPKPEFNEIPGITLSVDGTGVGRATVDMLRTEIHRRYRRGEWLPDVDFRPVAITGSDSSLRGPDRNHGYWSVPKVELIFPLVVAFQRRRLRIAHNLPKEEKAQLEHELKNFKRKVNIATKGLQFEAWRETDHDDLLFAAALALFGWQVKPRGTGRTKWILADGTAVTQTPLGWVADR